MKQPNVLVVLSDQQRPDSCGVFGQRLPVTACCASIDANLGRLVDHLHERGCIDDPWS